MVMVVLRGAAVPLHNGIAGRGVLVCVCVCGDRVFVSATRRGANVQWVELNGY